MMKLILLGSLITLSTAFAASPDQLILTMHKHVRCLRAVCQNEECNKRLVDIVSFIQDNDAISYKHELTRLALKKVCMQGNLTPLFEAWDVFLQRYRLVDVDLFIHEFSALLFFTYKNILSHYSLSKVSLAEVLQLSSQIMSLPIDQVLTALERCYHQFIHIMSAYGMQPGVSLALWIQRYWWVPPVVVLSFLYSTVRHFLNPDRPFNSFSQQFNSHISWSLADNS